MSDTLTDSQEKAPAGYRLGDPIALEDLLALPPGGSHRRYARDDEGRLCVMSPDHAGNHRMPLAGLVQLLSGMLEWKRWRILPEPGISFPEILSFAGGVLPPSRLGRKAIEPDVAVYSGRPRQLPTRKRKRANKVFSPDGLRLVIEVLSPGTVHADLRLPRPGKADSVDRWSTYLTNGVPEYWILNATAEVLGGLPARSGLFLRQVDGRWAPLEEGGVALADAPVHGLAPARSGLVRSAAVPGLVLDLDAFWDDVDIDGDDDGDDDEGEGLDESA